MLKKIAHQCCIYGTAKINAFQYRSSIFSSILEKTQGGGDITTGLDLRGMAISKAAKAGVNSSTKTVVIKRNTIMGETCLEKYQQQRYSSS